MKASEHNGWMHSQRLAGFLLSYKSTDHTTTHEAPSELFLKRKLRTRMDLIKPDMNKSVCAEQAKQKSHHDSHSKSHEYFVGQNVQAHNFRPGPRWAAGVIVERLGPLSYLVQIDSGVIWRRHVDHLRLAPDGLFEPNGTVTPNSPYNQIYLIHLISFQLSFQNSLQLSNKVLNKVFLKDDICQG